MLISRPSAQMRSLLVFSVLAATTAACSSKDSSPPAPPPAAVVTPDSGGLDQRTTVEYPAGPYGTGIGDRVANATFSGYQAFDKQQLGPISFADFYNPNDDAEKPKFLYFTIAAIWCGPCNQESAALPDVFNSVHSKGMAILQDVSENENYDNPSPATEADLKTKWLNKYKLPFPIVLDPAKNMTRYFDRNSLPWAMVVNTRTMKIVKTYAGFGSKSELTRELNSFASCENDRTAACGF